MGQTKWISGDWNAICDICGFQFKASELKENWKHQRVCKDDFEPRHPQYFVRARVEKQSVEWVRDDDSQGELVYNTLPETASNTGCTGIWIISVFTSAEIGTSLPSTLIYGGEWHLTNDKTSTANLFVTDRVIPGPLEFSTTVVPNETIVLVKDFARTGDHWKLKFRYMGGL